MNYIRLLELPVIRRNNKNEAVLIEFRILHHLEFLIRNCIYKLGEEWSHTIICGNLNYEYINNIINSMNRDIKIIKIDVDNLTQLSYNSMLLTKNFWDNFIGEKILIYQEDSCIFKTNINDFMMWDYIGAPWPDNYHINKHNVGNGGFSLRSKSIMLKCLDYIDDNFELSYTVRNYMKENNLILIPEDVFFTLVMEKYLLGTISDDKTAMMFSSESFNSDSLGGHQFWLNNPNWKTKMYTNIIKQLKSTFNGSTEHRGGWNTILSTAKENDFFNEYSQIEFYDIVEKNFIWDNNVDEKMKWIGVIHCTNQTPPYLNIINISQFFNKDSLFLRNIHNCLGLITLAPNVYDFMHNELLKLNINVNLHLLKHPINNDENIPKFNYESFVNNSDKKIIQIGQQLRKMTSIYLLETEFNKLWLTGTKNFTKIQDLFDKEKKYLNLNNININDVEFKYIQSFEEYDELMSKNIIFVDLFDTAANNVVLECIIRATPLLITKLPGAIFYLGEDYPMYFDSLQEISGLLTKENIIKTHNYLKKIKIPSNDEFIGSIVNIIHKN